MRTYLIPAPRVPWHSPIYRVNLCSSLEDRVRRPCDMSGYVLSAALTRTRREPPRWATSEVKGNHWAGVVINSVRRGCMAPRMNDHVVNCCQRIER